MNKFFIPLILGCFVMLSFTVWHNNFEEATVLAKKEHKHILLNFSGSDWCGPCIRLHKEVLESDAFQKFADTSLVMVNADFPRMKKNQLPAQQQKVNDQLADKYNSKGSFPYTVLLDTNGKVLKEWDGFPKESLDEFIDEVKSLIDADK
ncbi:MAG: thioredoxin family protein [Bacteroidota bacterium]|nr:thioredoxin family protein [Bacteroidota bacterium]